MPTARKSLLFTLVPDKNAPLISGAGSFTRIEGLKIPKENGK